MTSEEYEEYKASEPVLAVTETVGAIVEYLAGLPGYDEERLEACQKKVAAMMKQEMETRYGDKVPEMLKSKRAMKEFSSLFGDIPGF